MDSTESLANKSESVKVIVRCRPMSEKEKAAGHYSVLKLFPSDGAIEICNRKSSRKYFTFDAVYDSGLQTEIYDEVLRPLVDSVINGFNGTVFAYGQTGAGKTYTMEGSIGDPEHEGVIPNSFKHIFNHIARSENTQFLVSASYIEIYQENVRDLLSPNPLKKLDVRERNDTGVYVKDLTVFVCKTIQELEKIMVDGKRNRSIGTTNMNTHSSRSHAIFIINIESCESDSEGNQHVKIGKLNLVDLAGSERLEKTGAVGFTQKESIKINLSLSALGNVISALVDGKSTHVPYRDSKLTRLLQDSLGGNAKTIMVACVGPSSYNYDETMTTLRYANRAKNIKNKPVVNIDPKDAILLKYKEEISHLKAQLALKEAKRKKKKEPKIIEDDTLHEMEHILMEERVAYLNEQNWMTEEKEKILKDIKAKDEELRLENEAKEKIKSQLQELEAKLLCGGKNIIDHTNEQQKMLEKRRQELAEHKNIEREIKKKLIEEEFNTIEKKETYDSLQQEVDIKTRKLKKLFLRLQALKDDINDEEEINSFERQEKEQTIEALTRDIKLSNLVIDNFVNPEEKARFLENVQYDEDDDAWIIYPSNAPHSRYNTAERPLSANQHRRPTTSYALKMTRTSAKPRYRSENIVVVELAMPRKRCVDHEPLPAVDPYVKEAVEDVLADDTIPVREVIDCQNRINEYLAGYECKINEKGSSVSIVRRPIENVEARQRSGRRSGRNTPNEQTRPSRSKDDSEYPVPRGLVPKSKSCKMKTIICKM